MSMRDQTSCRYHRSVQLLVLLLTRISSCLIAYVFVEFVYFVSVLLVLDFVDFVAIAVMWK